jgi:hypothetical protein
LNWRWSGFSYNNRSILRMFYEGWSRIFQRIDGCKPVQRLLGVTRRLVGALSALATWATLAAITVARALFARCGLVRATFNAILASAVSIG